MICMRWGTMSFIKEAKFFFKHSEKHDLQRYAVIWMFPHRRLKGNVIVLLSRIGYKEYTAFIVKHEGDGYYWFKKYGTELKNTYTTFYSIMVEFIEVHKALSPKSEDGRLEVVY